MRGRPPPRVPPRRRQGTLPALDARQKAWVEHQLVQRASQYCIPMDLRVWIGTWNVGACKPSGVSTFLTGIGTKNVEGTYNPGFKPSPSRVDLYDVYVIGCQEIVDLNAKNLLSEHKASQPWEWDVQQTLGGQYLQLASVHLVGLWMAIYVKKDLRKDIMNVETRKQGTGIMGTGGNKGGVAIRFLYHNTSMCFVNSHLAAHKNDVAKRNADYFAILNRIKFSPLKSSRALGCMFREMQKSGGDDIQTRIAHAAPFVISGQDDSSGSSNSSSKGSGKGGNGGAGNQNSLCMLENSTAEHFSILSHDYVFWLGDLNYRLHLEDINLCYERIGRRDLMFLLANDQLLVEKQAGRAFETWHEGPINFVPTYKYQPGTRAYDRRESGKKRFPAWCDRIQWRTRSSIPFDRVTVEKGRSAAFVMGRHHTQTGVVQAWDATHSRTGSQGESKKSQSLTAPVAGTRRGSVFVSDHLAGSVQKGEAEERPCVQLLWYGRHNDMLSSDHRPVSALFRLAATRVDPKRQAELRRTLQEEVVQQASENCPVVRLQNGEQMKGGSGPGAGAAARVALQLPVEKGGTLQGWYGRSVSQGLAVRNTGRCPALVSVNSLTQLNELQGQYYDMDDPDTLRKSWLCLHPESSCVQEKQVFNFGVHVHLCRRTALCLSSREDWLGDLLLLSVAQKGQWTDSARKQLGSDLLVHVSANAHRPSVLGASLDLLVARQAGKSDSVPNVTDETVDGMRRLVPYVLPTLLSTISAHCKSPTEWLQCLQWIAAWGPFQSYAGQDASQSDLGDEGLGLFEVVEGLVDRISEHVLKNSEASVSQRVAALRSALDTQLRGISTGLKVPSAGESKAPDAPTTALCLTLLCVLDSLAFPVFPRALTKEFASLSEPHLSSWCTQAMGKVNPVYYHTFLFVCAWLRDGCRGASSQLQEAVVAVFSPVLFRCTEEELYVYLLSLCTHSGDEEYVSHQTLCRFQWDEYRSGDVQGVTRLLQWFLFDQ